MGDRAHTRNKLQYSRHNIHNGIVRSIETGTVFWSTKQFCLPSHLKSKVSTLLPWTMIKIIHFAAKPLESIGDLHDGHRNSAGAFQKDLSAQWLDTGFVDSHIRCPSTEITHCRIKSFDAAPTEYASIALSFNYPIYMQFTADSQLAIKTSHFEATAFGFAVVTGRIIVFYAHSLNGSASRLLRQRAICISTHVNNAKWAAKREILTKSILALGLTRL